jgi:hypothetical protein
VAGLRGLNAAAGLRGLNAATGLRGLNAATGLRGLNAATSRLTRSHGPAGGSDRSGYWRQ